MRSVLGFSTCRPRRLEGWRQPTTSRSPECAATCQTGRTSGCSSSIVNRQATGDLAGADNHNRTYALDGRWGIGQYGQVLGFVSRTQTPGLEGKDHAYNLVGATARKRGGWSSGILKLLTTSTRRWAF